MFLSDRDLKYALECEDLICNPPPTEYGLSGIDLHLDKIEEAKIWDPARRKKSLSGLAAKSSVGFGDFEYKQFAESCAIPVPSLVKGENQPVCRDGDCVILRPGGFLLWLTKEKVGTPTKKARYICFINGKSTRARLGLLVHMTAPTIDAGWWGQVTLEMANLGPFDLSLEEGDAIAQLVVAMMSSPPTQEKPIRGIQAGQKSVTGKVGKSAKKQ